MARFLQIDGARGEGGGQVLRTALSLSAVTGQPFEITRIRAHRPIPGLRPQHLAAVRAAALVSGARVGGAFDGSPDLRFEPGTLRPGEFRFEIATAGALTLVLQTVLVPLARAGAERSRVTVSGGTHVPASPSYHYLANHWAAVVERLGLRVAPRLERAGFSPRGGGAATVDVQPWAGATVPLVLEERGPLLSIRGTAGMGRLKMDVAGALRRAAQERLWEARRLEVSWDELNVPAASPGSFLLLEALFEQGRAAFGFLGQKGVRPDVLGDRAARTLLKFLGGEGAVDPHLADQLAVPMALGGKGGRVTTTEVSRHLETVAEIVSAFGIPARTWGRRGGPGGLEVSPS
ncbi:MAG TPA: RNA 3'-terminal phosphate cyclase [Vicinamibacteria bacterium]|nr:RNA 3'-terminal phosphate cyclase [Vicinamibacteria bacterium]